MPFKQLVIIPKQSAFTQSPVRALDSSGCAPENPFVDWLGLSMNGGSGVERSLTALIIGLSPPKRGFSLRPWS